MMEGEKPATTHEIEYALSKVDAFYEGLPFLAYEGFRQVSRLSEPKRLRGVTVEGYANAGTIGIGRVNEWWEPPYGWWRLEFLMDALKLVRKVSPEGRKGWHHVGVLMHPGKPYPLMLRPYQGAPVGVALAPYYPDGEKPWTLESGQDE